MVSVEKIESSFRLDSYDSIYKQLTSSNVGGPELLDNANDTQQIYIRLFAAVASAPLESTPQRIADEKMY